MFKNEDVLEFLTRIIKNSNSQNVEASKESIEKFTEYLKLTTMCDENTLSAIANVSECFEELVAIHEKTGICDLKPIFNPDNKKESKVGMPSVSEEIEEDEMEEKAPVLTKKRTFTKPYQEKHYDRYVPTSSNYSSGCGSSRSSSGSSCGSSSYSSYGSSCGSGGSYGSSC